MKRITIMLSLLASILLQASGPVDNQHRSIRKTLEKYEIEFKDLKPIKTPNLYSDQGTFLQSSKDEAMYIYIGRVNSCRSECAVGVEDCSSEYFDYFVIFNHKKEIQLVKVFNYQATHGQAIAAKGWLKQFIGLSSPRQLKLHKDIDVISGATVSAKAITDDINYRCKQLN